ncbi:MAG TPA: penicillin-binding transpeptidase domain-containing protein [Gammaproteobacteria bacterium]|nr:penicillin-binding transpeptidase domain-containing protein [Gammaproteobacteria bacterium]
MRHYFILLLLTLGVAAIAIRLVNLHIFNHDFLSAEGDLRTVRTVTLPAHRGMILDRNAEPLAISTPADSIWINPQEYFQHPEDITPLAEVLDLDVSDLAARLHKNRDREFLYLKRQISPELAQSTLDLDIKGVYTEREYRRFYPLGEAGAHFVGVTNIDGEGQEGIELAFNSLLRGQAGKKRVLKDRLGQVIEDLELITPNQDGQDIYLSIDRRIQYLAYRELKAAVTRHQAQAGSIVVLDVNTGEVLALVNQPSFNPNNRSDRPIDAMRNRAVTDLFEPGSTMKPLAMAAILETGQVDFDTEVETSPGYMTVHGKVVRDFRNYGRLSLPMVLRHSSNVGMTKLLLPLPVDEIQHTWQRMGLSQTTYSGLPGEQSGRMVIPPSIDPFSYATLAFGYGLSVTSLQLAQAYASIAHQGMSNPVSVVRLKAAPSPRSVLSQKVADAVRNMLILQENDKGTGQDARIPGYFVAGKTGTTRKLGESGYVDDRHIALFAGFAPASKPRVVVVVLIDEPTGGAYYGGEVAAPIFADVMSGVLRLLNIPPDKLPKS